MVELDGRTGGIASEGDEDRREHAALLRQADEELKEAAVDLEKLSELLRLRSHQVERLELLVDELLRLLPVPAIVVAPDERVVAISQGAIDDHGLSDRQLGRPIVDVLPDGSGEDVTELSDGSQLVVLRTEAG